MSLTTYLLIAAAVFVAAVVGCFRVNYESGPFVGRAEYLFMVSIGAGLASGLLWPLAGLTFIAGRIIRHTNTKGRLVIRCGKPNLTVGGLCSNTANPVTGACYLHEAAPPLRNTLPDGSVDIRAVLAEWDADYNRSAGAPRPDDRKDTTTDA